MTQKENNMQPLTVQQLRDMLEKIPADHVVFAMTAAHEFNALFFPVTHVTHDKRNHSITLWLD